MKTKAQLRNRAKRLLRKAENEKVHHIYYNCQSEAWKDTKDESFKVDMTPEGSGSFKEFKTQEEFWKWYNKE